jgi:hypothetical protein
MSPSGAGGVLGRDGLSGRGASRSGEGAAVPLCLQRVCGFFTLPYWGGWQLGV